MRTLCARLASFLLVVVAMSTPADAFDLQPGIGFIAVHDAIVGTELAIQDADGLEIERGTVDSYGSLIFNELLQGATYTIRDVAAVQDAMSATTLIFENHPDQSFYDSQTLVEGFQYIETRDGTLLSATVRPPLGRTLAEGPFPTVVEYSGYTVSDPNSPQPSTLILSALGFATVGVNMRGSGCSGGVLDLFDLPTTADGYDVVETVAAQPWVFRNTVGMVGISFPGISQLFVAGAQPPHLAAVAPFAVIADIYRSPGFPGGIFNNGFAQSWLQERADDAEPAPTGGQGWAIQRVLNGDTVCEANQTLRLQTEDPVDFTRRYAYYTPDLMDPRSPLNWIRNIEVPMLLSGAWQDEQVGGGFGALLRHMPRRPDVKFNGINGVHSSPLEPEIFWRWIEFLDLYVARKAPDPGRARFIVAPAVYQSILGSGTPTPPFPADRFDGVSAFLVAQATFESDPPFRVLFENGAGSATPGLPAPTFEASFKRWPPKRTRKRTWFFGPDGTLVDKKPRRGVTGSDSFQPDSTARPMQTLPGQGQDDSWAIMPPYDWQPLVAGTAVGYVTEVLTEDAVLVGPGSVDLWLRSSEVDTDLQVTLTEVREDGLETYVQNGWLRASQRRLDRKRANKLEPVHTHLVQHVEPMPAGEFTRVRIGLFDVAHVFHAGSRIRITIEAPGGDRTRWSFDTYDTGGMVTNEVGRSNKEASKVVLPLVKRVEVPTGLPPCPGLRGQPCRTYVPLPNGG